jgi:hypothetical protein
VRIGEDDASAENGNGNGNGESHLETTVDKD